MKAVPRDADTEYLAGKSSAPLKLHSIPSGVFEQLDEFDKVMWLCGIVSSTVSELENHFRSTFKLFDDTHFGKQPIDTLNIGKIPDNLKDWMKQHLSKINSGYVEKFNELMQLASLWKTHAEAISAFRNDLLHSVFTKNDDGKALEYRKYKYDKEAPEKSGFKRKNFDVLYKEYVEIYLFITTGYELRLIIDWFMTFACLYKDSDGAINSLFDSEQYKKLKNQLSIPKKRIQL